MSDGSGNSSENQNDSILELHEMLALTITSPVSSIPVSSNVESRPGESDASMTSPSESDHSNTTTPDAQA
jgi:hypothetical protein